MKTIIFFDLDGVIFDSYGLWDKAVEDFLSTVNLTYTTEMKQKLWQLNMLEAEHYLREHLASKNKLINQKF